MKGSLHVQRREVDAGGYGRQQGTGFRHDTGALQPATVISGDGRYIQFESTATNLIAADGNANNDAFVKGRDKEKVIGIIARHAGIEPALVRDGFLPALDPDQQLNKDFLKTVQAFFIANDMLKAPADIDRLVDPSFAAAAVATLGPYR